VTAREIELEVRGLHDDQEPWKHALPNGAVLHVRWMPRRHFGSWYLVWVSKRSLGHTWSSRKLTAMTPTTASKKARGLISKYGASPEPWKESPA